MKKMTLYTETVIDGAHNLNGYDGKCRTKHGHSWLLKVWIQGADEQKDNVGILFDFGNIKQIANEFDHKDINTVIKNENPTAENMSLYILRMLYKKNNKLEYRVRLYETAVLKETWCQRETDNFDGRLL